MFFCVYNIFHNKKRKRTELPYFISCHKGDTKSALFHCFHSYFIECSLCQFLPAGENSIYIKTIKTMICQGILPKNTLKNYKVLQKNPSMAMESRLTLFLR